MRSRRAATEEALEHALLLTRGQPRAAVADGDARLSAARPVPRPRSGAGGRILDRVLDQVVDHDREVLLGRPHRDAWILLHDQPLVLERGRAFPALDRGGQLGADGQRRPGAGRVRSRASARRPLSRLARRSVSRSAAASSRPPPGPRDFSAAASSRKLQAGQRVPSRCDAFATKSRCETTACASAPVMSLNAPATSRCSSRSCTSARCPDPRRRLRRQRRRGRAAAWRSNRRGTRPRPAEPQQATAPPIPTKASGPSALRPDFGDALRDPHSSRRAATRASSAPP